MPSILDLPGELRNEIYYTALNSDRDVRVNSGGALQTPALTQTNSQTRRETLSILEELWACPDTIVAQVNDLHVQHIHGFLRDRLAVRSDGKANITLSFHLKDPTLNASSFHALDAFFADCDARGWDITFRVSFDWKRYSLSDAARSINELFVNLTGNQVERLSQAMLKERHVQVRRALVERPARRQQQIAHGSRDFRRVMME